jgi:hypothetical protein
VIEVELLAPRSGSRRLGPTLGAARMCTGGGARRAASAGRRSGGASRYGGWSGAASRHGTVRQRMSEESARSRASRHSRRAKGFATCYRKGGAEAIHTGAFEYGVRKFRMDIGSHTHRDGNRMGRLIPIGVAAILVWMGLAAAAHAQQPAGWIDAGEGFYYQPPIVAGGEGPLEGQSIATIQIQSQSADLSGTASFRIIVFSNEGQILRELTKSVSGFTPGASLIVDFPLGDIDRDVIGRVVLRTEHAEHIKAERRK